jgi:hypothetical protein
MLSALQRATNQLRKLPRWLRLSLTAIGVVLTINAAINVIGIFVFKPVQSPNFGVSFSVQRSKDYGLNWQANFLALLDDLSFKRLRLMSYWPEIEPSRGQFNFTDLDWQMDEAAKRGAKVALAIGMRQPRWPECYQPDWAKQLQGNDWKQALYAYMEVVVKRYQNHPALGSWQIENEAFNNAYGTWYGQCGKADRQRLEEEFALVRKLDKTHPANTSLSDEYGLPLGQPVPDNYGISVYKIAYTNKGILQYYGVFTPPTWYHRLRLAIIGLLHQRPVYIHELQLEPWGPQDTKNLSVAEQDKSMSLQQLHTMLNFGKSIGTQDIDLWGGEWWYWRKVHLNDNSVWDAIKTELANH